MLRGNSAREHRDGFVCVSLKHLNDNTPSFMPMPVRLNGSKIEEIAGLDPRTTAFYNAHRPLHDTRTG